MSHHLWHPRAERRVDSPARKPHPTRPESAPGDAATGLRALNQALTIAHITVLFCKHRYHIALRHHSPPLAAAALEHANDAKLHANRITERIVRLGGTPEPSPETLPHCSRSDRDTGNVLLTTISEHLIASRAASESYAELATFFSPVDPETRKLLEDIAAGEHERGDDLSRLHDEISTGSAPGPLAETTKA